MLKKARHFAGALLIAALMMAALTACSSSPSSGNPNSNDTSASTESSQNAEATQDTASAEAPTVKIKSSLADYSWGELALISEEIAAASDRDSVANNYNLLTSSGTLDGNQRKTILLYGDTPMDVILMGYDENGLAFIYGEAAATGNFGVGKVKWSTSDVRSYLNSDGLSDLPEDLQEVLKSVEVATKRGSSHDKLWLPSAYELGDDWYGEEGYTYKLFADAQAGGYLESAKTREFYGSDGARTCSWWTRTQLDSDSAEVAYVNHQGKTGGGLVVYANSTYDFGYVPCFYIGWEGDPAEALALSSSSSDTAATSATGSPADNASAGFAKSWTLLYMEDDEVADNNISETQMQVLKSQGTEIVLTLHPNGKCDVGATGQTQEYGTWSADSDTTGEIEIDGDRGTLEILNGKLYYTEGSSTMVFE